MTRYSRVTVDSASSGWDAIFNSVLQQILDRPFPILVHAGNLSSLASARPANQHDRCLAICQYSASAGDGYQLAQSDGTNWNPMSNWQLMRAQFTTNPASPYTVLVTDDFVYKSNGTALTVNLPASAASGKGRRFVAKNKAGSANNLTLTPNGADTIDGAATLALTPGQSAVLVDDGAGDWLVI